MANPAESEVQNLLPVQAYFDVNGNFQTFIGQGKPFTAIIDPNQSGLHITNSTIDSSVIGGITPAAGNFTTATVSTQPVSATDVVNLLALQAYAAGISWKQPCVAATLTNITLSGLQTIDGHPVTAGNRVLVKNQGTASENGIYLASASNWTRSEDANSWNELICAISFIEYGTQAGGAWFCTAQDGGTINVTPVNWSQFTTSATYTAGTGLTLTGTQFSITPVGTAATYGSASTVPVFTTNASGQVSSVTNTNIAIGATQITSGTIDSARLSGSYTGITGVGTLGSLTVTNPITGSVTGSSASTTNLLGGAVGSLPYQTATNTTGFLAASTDGYILALASGIPAWIPNTVGTVTAVTASAPLASSGGSTPNITITQSSGSSDGYLSSTDWTTFNNKANSGANSNITSMTGITGGISSPDFIAFDTTYATTLTAGQLGWNGNDTLGLGMIGGNVIQHIGEDQFFYIKATATITKGQVIMFTGAVGASGVATGAPATGVTDGTYIMGVAAENIANNGFGLIQTFGTLRNINTTGYADGDILWYDPAVTGGLTKTKPVAPNIKVQMAAVINGGSSGGGTILIRIDPGSTLGGSDSNAQITSPTNGQIISYDGGNGYWKNTSLTAGTGISISSSANGVLTIANTVSAGITITDDTTTNATRYLAFTSATSGSITGQNVASTKLQFNPSSGLLSSVGFTSSGSSNFATSSGNVGVGTASPLGKFVVSNGSDNNFEVFMTNPGGGAATTLQTYNRAGSVYGDMYYQSLNHYFYTNGTEAFKIDSNGVATFDSSMMEKATVTATAATGTINFDAITQPVLFYTSNASANWTVNLRGSSGVSLNSMMATGQSLTVAFLVTQGATPYYNSAFQIDGSSVTPKWQGGSAPTAGNASGVDVYTYTVIKTGSATYSVFASLTQFK